MIDYLDNLGLSVITLICSLEVHGHLSQQKILLERLELTDKEAENFRERSGILLPQFCTATGQELTSTCS